MWCRPIAIPTLVAGLVSGLPAAGAAVPPGPGPTSQPSTSCSASVSPGLEPACPTPAGVASVPPDADVIFLKNGSAIRADSVEVDGDRVRFTWGDVVVVLPLAVVDRIVPDDEGGASPRSSPGAGPAVPGTPGTGPAGREDPGRGTAGAGGGPAAGAGEARPPAAEADRLPPGLGADDDLQTPDGKSWDDLPDDPRTPEYWRSRKRWVLALIGRIEAHLEPLPEYDFPASRILDGRILWTIRERERLEGRLERARAFLDAFEERARRAGVPPGWLRLR